MTTRKAAAAILLTLSFTSMVMAESTLKAGVARRVITPSEYIWMSGYASRNKPAEGKEHELFAKAVALEDAHGQKLVFVGSDLIGLPRALSVEVADEVHRKTGLPRAALMLTASHTHCGPVVRDNLMDMFNMSEEMRGKIGDYTKQLKEHLVAVAVEALHDLKPARVSYASGKARFAINRRQPTGNGIALGRNEAGPVDHDVPVLRINDMNGLLRAVVFGYACHNTTLDYYRWCGDYAGFAQAEVEAKHPHAVALYWIGCGGDANPDPRRTVELAKKHGKELAAAVDDVLKRDMKPLDGKLRSRYVEIPLTLGTIPDRDKWAADLLSTNFALKTRAKRMIEILDSGKPIPDKYEHYPVQVWRIGELTWVGLGGEVVVDYALAIKKKMGVHHPVWITGYANDVMAYIPSKRVLLEGGYEADSSMIYYGLPTKWAPEIEESILSKVFELMQN